MTQRYNFPVLTNLGAVGDPTLAQDAATKNYVDTNGGGFFDSSYSLISNCTVVSGGALGTSTVTVTGNQAATFPSGSQILLGIINTRYPVASAIYDGSQNTAITITGSFAGNTPAGSLVYKFTNTRVRYTDLALSTGLFGLVDNNNVLTLSATSTGAGLTLEVDGTIVPPTAGVINFVDSTALTNRIAFVNYIGNRISAEFDSSSGIVVTEIGLTNAPGTASVTLDYPATGNSNYTLYFPPTQGAANTLLRNDGAGNLSWVAPTASTGTVNQVFGTSGNISAAPATAGATSYSLDLVNVGSPGTYTYATITTDAKGRVTGATNNTPVTTFGFSATPRTGPVTIAAGTNVTINESPNGTFTFNATGGTGGGTVSQVLGTAGNISANPATANAATYSLDLVNVGTSGTYSYASITTDAKGRVTAATANTPVTTFGLTSAPRTGSITIAAGTNVSINESPNGTYTINATGGGGGGYPLLNEPAWRTVAGSGTSVITVTDNSQPAPSFFAGLNFIQLQFTWTTNCSTITASSGGQLIVTINNIAAMQTTYNITFSVGESFATVFLRAIAATIVDPVRWHVAGNGWNGTYTALNVGYTGTISPFGTGASFTVQSSNSWNGGTSIIQPATTNYVANVSGPPQFRRITPDDILPAISGTPVEGQVVTWNALANTSIWHTPTVGTVVQVLGAPGDLSASPSTPNAAIYTLDLVSVGTAGTYNYASITTDNKGRVTSAVPNTPVTTFGFSGAARNGPITIVSGTNVTINESPNGVYTFNATGGGGGSGSVSQVLGTTNNINVTPATSGSSTYTVDLANAGTAGTYNYASVTTDAKGRVTAATANTPVTGVGLVGTPRSGTIALAAGANVTITEGPNGTFTISSSGGGGGGTFTTSVVWTTANTSSKNAYTSPGVVNNDGITINLIASSGSGQITAATIRLNGVALTNTYASTGTFPNYTIVIPSADLVGNVAETTSSVTIGVTGTWSGGNINIATAGTLTNVQPVAFTTTLTVAYTVTTLPYYTTTANMNYSYSNSANITAFNGVVTPTGGTAQNANAASGIFNNQPVNGAAISGNATGNGLNGAGSATVTLSGSVPAITIYIPAFYSQTTNSTPPTFTTSSSRTTGAAQGSILTYPSATATTQYNWICTQRPLANLLLRTSLGDTVLVPDVTGANQTIAGQVFSVYGWTQLAIGTSSVLVIT